MKQHTREELLKALEDNLSRYYLVSFQEANEEQMYGALSRTIRDLLLIQKRISEKSKTSANKARILSLHGIFGRKIIKKQSL